MSTPHALTERVPANTVAATANGTVNLQKLEGAGLAAVINGEIRLSEAALTALNGPSA